MGIPTSTSVLFIVISLWYSDALCCNSTSLLLMLESFSSTWTEMFEVTWGTFILRAGQNCSFTLLTSSIALLTPAYSANTLANLTYVFKSMMRVETEQRGYLECRSWNWVKGKELESFAIRCPNSPRMYPPTFTIFSWHALACNQSNKFVWELPLCYTTMQKSYTIVSQHNYRTGVNTSADAENHLLPRLSSNDIFNFPQDKLCLSSQSTNSTITFEDDLVKRKTTD